MLVSSIRNCAWAACLLPALLLAQKSQISVSGTVVNLSTGEPIRQALVRIFCFAHRPNEPLDQIATSFPKENFSKEVFTDFSGTFRFDALPAGNCTVQGQKPQFTFVQEHVKARNSMEMASVEGLRLGLSPLGVITGKVVDQQGQPVYSANVIALSMEVRDGLRQINTRRNVSTDDRGVYRFWNLQPGKYYIQATGLAGRTSLFAGDASPVQLIAENFAPVYFEGGKSLESAHPIEIQAGTQANANLSVNIERAYKIRGSLTNFVPHRTVQFELGTGEESNFPGRVNVNADTGVFELLNLVPGSYSLHAKQEDTTAELLVTITDSDMEGINLSLASPVDIPVLTRFTNTPKATPVSDEEEEPMSVGSCMPLLPSGSRNRAHIGLVDLPNHAEGQALRNVLPGKYHVQIECAGGYAISALSGTQDLFVNPDLVVQPSTIPPSIEITAVHGGSNLQGTVASKEATSLEQVMVLLVPQFPNGYGPQLIQGFRSNGGKEEYQFQFFNLAPGNYIVYAFSNNTDIEFRSSQFLQSLTGGTPVYIESNKPASVTITEPIR